jgi:hypothetical protein
MTDFCADPQRSPTHIMQFTGLIVLLQLPQRFAVATTFKTNETLADQSGYMTFQSSFMETMVQPSLGPSSRPLSSFPKWELRS